jgi:ribonuclease P protein component
VIARLVRSADFERVLRTRTRVNSVHFAVHHVPDRPSLATKASKSPGLAREFNPGELSTATQTAQPLPVDDSGIGTLAVGPGAVWLGAVVPKRHARRSVTRTLLKRQIRAVVTGHAATLAGGLWVVRLRAPFDRTQFVSAASNELKQLARTELEHLMLDAAQRGADR